MERTARPNWEEPLSTPRQNSSSDPKNAAPVRDEEMIIVPPAEVRALVRFDRPSAAPPDDLIAFVIEEQGDWVLTDDALAFGDPDILDHFTAWRATWEREWVLDPRTTIVRLLGLAKATGSDPSSETTTLTRLIADTRGSDDMLIPPDLVSRCRAELGRLGELARDRDELGHGLIDLTPNTHRTGLARSWPSWGGPEVLAAVHGAKVVLDPQRGLFLQLGEDTTLGPIDVAISDTEGWTVHAGDESVRLDHDRARPLAWLVPGATAWRHQRVPDVITWTRTLIGLDASLEFAESAGLTVRLTTRRPIQQL